ncbi:MAG: preprotein translocase subunit SecA [Acidimicrobiaceae bacterium]|nr:preprotein translocase subunit SecA [Acidimicrobiaceae bacterium]
MSVNPLKKVLRSGEGKKLKALEALVPDISELESDMKALSDTDLQAKTGEFKQRIERGEGISDLLIEAFAVVREAAWRVIGQRHYDVQLVGGAALHFGWVAEMRTGEGKTLTSTLPIYLNALSGKGVHVVTVNDYLAARDSEWMGEIYKWLGLEVGLVVPGNRDSSYKKLQYDADVTYGTNNELGFDYLRDNMAMELSKKVQRGHNYCIVDEIDSILIDEARTPLIISGKLADAAQTYYKFASIVQNLQRDRHYEVDEEKRTVAPTEEGVHAVERALNIENLYDAVSADFVHQFQVALKAKELFHRDKDYILSNGEVKIVDEFTGRILDGRRWSDGLHQAVEAKEGVTIKEENQTLATITLQNYFRLYDKLAGMTGTAETEAAEFFNTYGLHVVPIPTNKPVIRDDAVDFIYRSEKGKYGAVVEDIVERNKKGQPVLVGTISVEKSELVSDLLDKRGISHSVLNAKLHAREADVVAQAGRIGAVTVATNMAGRGVDIILGGNPEGLAERDVMAEGLKLDEEAGSKRYEELLSKYEPICAEEGETVKEAGGLYVLGTERHDSRRIDNQLRGRSGRQGDPGESRFYLSLEDELMRLFATGAMEWVMKKALPDDVPIGDKMVTKAIERAQNTVEQRNAETRKNVLKYDEVMNEQRKVVYARRNEILNGDELRDETSEFLALEIDEIISSYCDSEHKEEWDLDALVAGLGNLWPNEFTPKSFQAVTDSNEIYELAMEEVLSYCEDRENQIGSEVMRKVEGQIMLRILDQRWREHLYAMDYLKEGIHLRAMGQKDPLTEWQREGFEMFGTLMDSVGKDFVKYITHIQIDSEPEGEQSSSLEKQASDVSYSGTDEIAAGAIATLTQQKSGVDNKAEVPAREVKENSTAKQSTIVKSDFEKTGRNEPCPCGSGKKFKQCHGK